MGVGVEEGLAGDSLILQHLQPGLEEVLLCDVLDLFEAFDDLKDGVVEEAVGQAAEEVQVYALLVF